jgi:hypothetical protein
MTFVVLLTTSTLAAMPYGPFGDRAEAESFAEFLSKEVDPAVVAALRSPTLELLAFWRNGLGRTSHAAVKPDNWPPTIGDVWKDRHGHLWICTETGTPHHYLVCITKRADDNADEIWNSHGPLTYYYRVSRDEEPPF